MCIFSLTNTSKSTAQLLDLKRLIKLQDDWVDDV